MLGPTAIHERHVRGLDPSPPHPFVVIDERAAKLPEVVIPRKWPMKAPSINELRYPHHKTGRTSACSLRSRRAARTSSPAGTRQSSPSGPFDAATL